MNNNWDTIKNRKSKKYQGQTTPITEQDLEKWDKENKKKNKREKSEIILEKYLDQEKQDPDPEIETNAKEPKNQK